MTGLAQRLTTGSIFVIVMIAGLYINQNSFVALFGLITVLALWELLGILLPDSKKNFGLIRKVFGVAVGMLPFCTIVMLYLQEATMPPVSALVLLTGGVFCFFLIELFAKSEKPFDNIAYFLLATFYVGIPFSLLIIINDLHSPNVILGMLLLVWANDSFAYLVGSKIGKTPLFPRISPKKTWEGSTGGLIATFLTGIFLSYVFNDLSLISWIILAGIASIFGSLGDLVESMFKRSMKIKDSGKILPGHGGILDRFDAFIFIIPFTAIYLIFWA